MGSSPCFSLSGLTVFALFAPCTSAAAQGQHPTFPAAVYRAGQLDDLALPRQLVVGDVSGDGLPDAILGVTHAFSSGAVHVLRGNLQGGFGAPTSFGAGFGSGTPYSMATGDINGDGRGDLVLSTFSFFNGAVVMVYTGTAQGALQFVGEFPGSGVVALGDLNGLPGAEVILVQPTQVCVLRSNAQGQLDTPVCYLLSGNGYRSLAVGDVDGDLRADVVAASSNRVCILRGNAQGTLDPAQCQLTGGSDADFLALGDVTGDTRLDAVLVDSTSTMVCVMAGNAQGTLDPAVCYASGVAEILSIAVGDVSADGRQDVVLAGWAPNFQPNEGQVCVLAGNAGGTLDAAVAYVPGLVRPTALALADLAGDGRLEVVFGNAISIDACVLESDGQGGLAVATHYATGGQGPVALGDVSGDGLLDVVQSRDSDDSVCVLNGNLQGTLDVPVCYPAGGNPGQSIATGELSGDTFLDVVVSTGAGVCVLNGNALGTLDAAACYPAAFGDLAVGDVSGDGRPDVVHSSTSGVCVFQANAQGTLDAQPCIPAPAGRIAIGDIDGDLRLDVVLAPTAQPAEICVLAGNAQGTLDPPVCYSAGGSGGASGVAIGDVDGDGLPDVVVSTVSGPGGGQTCVLLGNALGTLEPGICEIPEGAPTSVRLGDMNDDGILDVVEGSFTSDSDGSPGGIYVGVRDGGVQGGLGSLRRHASGASNPGGMVLGDLNHDGRLDAIVPGGFHGSSAMGVSVLENRFPSLGTVTCTGGICPCSNAGTGERGCQNSASTGGARLYGSGEPSLADDTARLFASGEMPSALTIFLQGDAAIPPTNFGDGLRCAGGALKRLYVKNASQGAISAPATSEPSISARSAILGDVLSVGDVRVYQTYYRDPNQGFCPSPTGGTFNSSNALSVTWVQ